MPEPAPATSPPATDPGHGDPLLGTQIGPFTLVRRLGEGGMGTVYLARQEKPAREVALKILRAAVVDDLMLRRFELEAEMLGRLQHPGIAQIHQAGTFTTPQGAQPYFAMEHVDGKPVDEYVRLHSLTLKKRLELAAHICDAVQHAHQKGLVHRDLKPGNILVTQEGEPKILDFGVARLLESDTQMTAHTRAGDLVGTLAYMSPEQVSAETDDLDTRSDVYALGVVLYELLTGELPFRMERKMVHEIVRVIREEEPRRLSTIDRVYRGDVETIVSKALEKDRSRRYQSASALAADLRHFLADEPIAARPASAIYQLVKFARRHRAACASLLAIAVALVVGTGVATWQALRASAAEKRAEAQADLARSRERQAQVQRQHAEEAAAFARAIFGGVSPYVANGQDTKLLQTLLRQAEARIATELREVPEVEGSIRTTLGTAYTNLGLYPEAREQLDKAAAVLRPLDAGSKAARELLGARGRLQLRLGEFAEGAATLREQWQRCEQELGPDVVATIEARDTYADALMRAGRYADSAAEARAALAAAQRVCSEHAATTLRVMSTLAVTLSYLGNGAEAETLMRKVLEARRRDPGPEALTTWESAGTLAMLIDAAHPAEAETLDREALEQLTRLLGPEHPQTLNLKNNLGVALQNQKRYAEAEATFRAVAKARVRVLGADHPDTLFAWANVADTMLARGQLDAAEPLLRTVLEGRRKRLSSDHPHTLHSLKALAELLRARGDYAGGAALLGEAAQAARRMRKPEEASLHIALYNWAAALQDADDHGHAEPVFRETLALHDEHDPKDAPFAAATLNGLAKCVARSGDAAAADELFEKGLAMRRRLFGAAHREIGYSLLDYGQALVDRESWPAAERILRVAVANATQETPANPLELAKAQALLGGTLLASGGLAEAETLLSAAEPELARASAAEVRPKLLAWVHLRLAELCDAKEAAETGRGHAAAAAAWRAKAAEK